MSVFFCVSMETVQLVDEQKKAFINALRNCPHDHKAAQAARVPISMVRRWFEDDPDFNLVCTEIKELVVDEIEARALELAKDGSENMIKFVLPALRPDVWNPAQKVEVETVGHRFIDFTGNDIHGEATNGDSERSGEDTQGGTGSEGREALPGPES